jgi:hypothetical protein
MLCYVGHHDDAYGWAERRKLETHPKTGAAQLVEIRETVKEIVVPIYVQAEVAVAPKPAPEKKPLFVGISDDELLGYGVPADWLNDVKKSNEDTLLALTDHLPAEASEALLELATGGKPRVAQPTEPVVNPFEHPDAQRRFRDGECRGIGTRAGFSMGKVDRIPSPRTKTMGGSRLYRSSASLRLGGYRKNNRSIASCGPSGSHTS